MKKLEKMEEELGISDPESPTQKPGSDLIGTGNKHRRRMLSLMNTYSAEEIGEWYDKIATTVIVEKKFDGGSSSIFFKNGKPIKALTRGDGETGEDITENVKLMNWLNISSDFTGEVRGELIISKEGFKILNRNNEYQNARNLLSGTMKLLNREIFKERSPYILFKAYYLEDSEFKTHHEAMDFLTLNGFDIGAPYFICKTKDEMLSAIDRINNEKATYDIEIDGAVIKIDDVSVWKLLGETKKYPRWGRAYKYKQEEANTIVREIIYQVGMSGKITPKARFDPVFIDGSEIEYLTLNNKDYMTSLGIRIGDEIVVHKAAGIIPECVRVEQHSENSKPEAFPTHCPSCKTKLVKLDPEHADYFCTNKHCPEKVISRFFNFTHVLNIDGFSDATVAKLIGAGYLNSLESLYELKKHRTELIALDRLGEKSVDNLLKNIEASKNVDFYRFLASLGIPNIGMKTAEVICAKYKDPESLNLATEDDLASINTIGTITAKSLYSAIHEKENIAYESYHTLCKIFSFKKVAEVGNKLAGKSFCITGSLSRPRSEVERMIKAAGGNVTSTVSSKTSFLINNDVTSNSGKNKKAKELNIKIIDEEEFMKLL